MKQQISVKFLIIIVIIIKEKLQNYSGYFLFKVSFFCNLGIFSYVLVHTVIRTLFALLLRQ